MSVATAPVSTNMMTANTILRQIGFMVRGCLDMKGANCRAIENGVIAMNVIVGPRKRGNIEIVLNGKDLYDITVSRNTIREGKTILHEWADIDAEMLPGVLDSLWR